MTLYADSINCLFNARIFVLLRGPAIFMDLIAKSPRSVTVRHCQSQLPYTPGTVKV